MSSTTPREGSPLVAWCGLGLLVALHLAAVWHTAWVSDDAFITFRTVDNALAGYGPVWNVAERVQAYTHPLWMGLLWLGSWPTGAIYETALVLGAGLSVAALAIGTRVPGVTLSGAALMLAVLLASRAWIDYATSGLENPLSHVLLACVAWTTLRPDRHRRASAARFGLLAACLLTRLDLLFAAGPALAYALWRDGERRIGPALLGLAPFFVWECFSLFYYGSPIANSALAKLGSGLGAGDLVPQGLAYLGNSLRWDPVTLVAIAAGVALATLRGSAAARALAAGAVLQLVWIVWVGGDFMSGRFLTPSLWLAVLLLGHAGLDARVSWTLAAGIALAGVSVPYLSPFVARDYGSEWSAAIDAHGIADERHFHRGETSLAAVREDGGWDSEANRAGARRVRESWNRDPWIAALTQAGVLSEGPGWPPPTLEAASRLRPVLVKGGVGVLGFRVGPEVHVLDYHGLGDPLLSRLPARERDPVLGLLIPRLEGLGWRVGHYLRNVPSGYAASLSEDANRIADPQVAALNAELRLVTRGELLDAARLAAIWRLNTRGWTASRPR